MFPVSVERARGWDMEVESGPGVCWLWVRVVNRNEADLGYGLSVDGRWT